MTVPAVGTPAQPAPPVAPPEPPSAPPAAAPPAPPAPAAPQKPAGDPRPRSQRNAAPPPAAPQDPPAPVTPPPPPALPAPEPPAPPPAPPAPPGPKPKSEAEIIQEHEARQAREAEQRTREAALVVQRDAFANGKLKIRDLLNSPDTVEADVIAFVDTLVDGGIDAARLVTKGESAGEVQAARQEVLDQHEEFKSSVVSTFFEALPENLHEAYTGAVNGKPVDVFVSELLKLAPSIPSVRQAFLEEATTTGRELVPEANRTDFDTELQQSPKDLKGVAHALFQAGFLAGSDAPPGARTARESGPGGMDMERWKTDRAFRRGLTREENNRYLAESQRLENAKQGLSV